jgi:hypothetical protein
MVCNRENNPIVAAYTLAHPELKTRIEQLQEKYAIHLIPSEQAEGVDHLPLLRVTKNELIQNTISKHFFSIQHGLIADDQHHAGTGDRFLQAAGITEGHFSRCDHGVSFRYFNCRLGCWRAGESDCPGCSPFIHILVSEGLDRLEKIRPSGIATKIKKKPGNLAKASARIDRKIRIIGLLENGARFVCRHRLFDPMFRDTVDESHPSCDQKVGPPGTFTVTLLNNLSGSKKKNLLKEKRYAGN